MLCGIQSHIALLCAFLTAIRCVTISGPAVVNVGQSVTFRCSQLSTVFDNRVTWTFNGRDVTQLPWKHTTVTTDNGVGTTTLKMVAPENLVSTTGTVECSVKSYGSPKTASKTVRFIKSASGSGSTGGGGSSDSSRQLLIRGPSKVQVKKQVTYTCESLGGWRGGGSFDWTWNGQFISSLSVVFDISIENGRGQLSVTIPQDFRNGTLGCQYGFQTTSMKVSTGPSSSGEVKCSPFGKGDGYGGSEIKIGSQSDEECIKACIKMKVNDEAINGVSVRNTLFNRACYCEKGMTGRTKSSSYKSCYLYGPDDKIKTAIFGFLGGNWNTIIIIVVVSFIVLSFAYNFFKRRNSPAARAFIRAISFNRGGQQEEPARGELQLMSTGPDPFSAREDNERRSSVMLRRHSSVSSVSLVEPPPFRRGSVSRASASSLVLQTSDSTLPPPASNTSGFSYPDNYNPPPAYQGDSSVPSSPPPAYNEATRTDNYV